MENDKDSGGGTILADGAICVESDEGRDVIHICATNVIMVWWV